MPKSIPNFVLLYTYKHTQKQQYIKSYPPLIEMSRLLMFAIICLRSLFLLKSIHLHLINLKTSLSYVATTDVQSKHTANAVISIANLLCFDNNSIVCFKLQCINNRSFINDRITKQLFTLVMLLVLLLYMFSLMFKILVPVLFPLRAFDRKIIFQI